jgi:Zn-dependent protease with chaperone function
LSTSRPHTKHFTTMSMVAIVAFITFAIIAVLNWHGRAVGVGYFAALALYPALGSIRMTIAVHYDSITYNM